MGPPAQFQEVFMLTELPVLSRNVAVEVLVHGAQSRAQLGKKLGLSPATMTRIVKPLVEAGVLVEEAAIRLSGRGRSSLPLDVVAGDYRFVGVKLTAETLYAVVTDLRAEIVDAEVVPVPSFDVPDVVAAVLTVVERLRARAGLPVSAVGVTVGGSVDKGETVADSPFLHWHGVPFRMLLAREIDVPVYLANDVVGLTKAQQWFGHGRAWSNFALLTVGAGVGYGLVINAQLVPTMVAPVSHFPIDQHGPLCPDGHRGCLTAYVTAPAMTAAASFGQRRELSYDEVLQEAEAGDPLAGRVVAEAAYALGRATAAVTCLTGVDRIILSGEGVRLAELGHEALRAGRTEYGAAYGLEPVIRPMDFTEWARGAAVIAVQREFPCPPIRS